MKSFLTLEYEQETDVPPEFADDVRTPETYVRHFLGEFSEAGDVVLDPFAGFGTTLTVAEELSRVPYGVEYEEDRAAVIRDRIGDEYAENVIRGSALELDALDLPPFDCCLTSPPYMVEGMETNPFRNYALDSESDYGTYLADVRDAFAQLRDLDTRRHPPR
jgi:DNA modification methylase